MKNTSRIKIRIIAGILSAITIISVGTVAMASASAATLPSTGDKASDIVINAGYQAGLAAIKLGIPGGTAIAPMLDSIIGSFMPKGPSLTDINSNINELRSEISTQFAEVKKQITDSTNAVEKKIVNQSVIAEKGDSFDSLMTAMKATDRQLRSISENDDLNDQEKAVEMAYLIGDNADWLKKDNVYFQYEDFMNTLSSSTFSDCGGRDLFRVIYDDYTAKYPNFIRSFENVNGEFNKTVDLLEKQAENGEIFLIAPSKPVEVTRFDGDMDKLGDLYWLGWNDMSARVDELKGYLNQ